ncbi:glycosyl hydrolase family 32 [Gilliamella sp. wkB178]|uniref:glycoside hydrolase family 32 protein n=1 Tax=Gilliamella sp. wkB178 TaxID=3120259 RepID=UPI00080EE730|nr:sucrose-6-phosphate hydrolase [Gilliamella apicola]OCG10197.1 glycosyl hydrolase family 32 [Gilliamella apicola]
MSTAIKKANQAVQQLETITNKQYYPHFHLAPLAGWMNDPNGLIYFKGQYHAFYQHHPYDENWGLIHWGHAVSDDLISWRRLPIALAPDQEFDKSGCFSGSAVANNDELCLFYTGHVYLQGQDKFEAIHQTQCLATSKDGVHFEKQGVVLEPKKGIVHFRDPKVWQQDGNWWMVVGQSDLENIGQVLLYRSDDLRHWTFDHIVVSNIDPKVYMLECPDFFPLGDKWILMFSPQGMQAKSYKYRNLFQSGYIVGNWRPGQQFTISKHFQEMDFGHDFYAPQSFLAADGRRLVFAWMDMWESKSPSKQDKWRGCFTIPRELILDGNNHLRNRPIKELETLREKSKSLVDIVVKDQLKNTAIESINCELIVEFDMTQSNAERFGLQLAATPDGKQATLLYVDLQSQRIILDRSFSGLDLKGYRSVRLPKTKKLCLHIYVDVSSVEVFVNNDLYSFSSRIYPKLPAKRQVNLFAENGTAKIIKLDSWQLKSIYE